MTSTSSVPRCGSTWFVNRPRSAAIKFVDLYARDSGLRDKLIAERDVVLTYALRASSTTA